MEVADGGENRDPGDGVHPGDGHQPGHHRLPKSRPDIQNHCRDLDELAFIIGIINLTAGHQED